MTEKKPTPILERAILCAGGVKLLAQELGVSQPRVSMWRKRGVPVKWIDTLIERYARRKPKKLLLGKQKIRPVQ